MSDTKNVVPTEADESVDNLSIAEIERQTKLLQLKLAKQALEAQTLELEERAYHIKDLKARLADRDIVEKQAKEDREQQGRTFAQQDATDQFNWARCTHRKGGNVSPQNWSVLRTGGNAVQYAIMKHQMINGDIWVRCLRCGKTWKPPVEKDFFFDLKGKNVAPADGKFDKVRFEKVAEEYRAASMFPTNNSMSTSVQCRFGRAILDSEGQVRFIDAADTYRENIASSNLR